MTEAQAAERVAEPSRVTALGAAAGGFAHLLPDHDGTTTRCGFTAWRSHVICSDWFEGHTGPVRLADLAPGLGAEIPADVLAELDEMAGPWSARWLLRPRKGNRGRAVGVCAGPDGWGEGLEVLGARYDAVGLDLSGGARTPPVPSADVCWGSSGEPLQSDELLV
ncbi:hypothetical protein ACIP93_32520 [Streptomyces sp. NPDC088745]|uniref:hypothetical protein n=1 Tax=Streptomyces sp. NPDC088745 TaxID=3365884 RepID=UPI00382C31FC